MEQGRESKPRTPGDSQDVVRKALAVAAAVAELVEPTKQVLAVARKALDERPSITFKPAGASDPSSKPALVVGPPHARAEPRGSASSGKGGPPEPRAVEIPLDLPKPEKTK